MRTILTTGVIIAAATIAGCAGMQPRERAVVERAVVPAGNAVLTGGSDTPVMTEDRLRLLAVDLRSPRELLLYYAGNNDFDRVTAQIRTVREVHRIDPQTGDHTRIDPDDASWEPRYRDFTDRTPEESRWFGGALVINPEEYERRYTVLIEGPPGAPVLPMALRATYGRGPDQLRVTFFAPLLPEEDVSAGEQNPRYRRFTFTYRLSALDISSGVTARLLRTLSAVRWDGERYVTFLDSIYDLKEGRQLRLVHQVPTGFVELITVDPDWSHTAIMSGELRVSKRTSVTPIVLDEE